MLISCGTQFPRAPAPEPKNESILSQEKFPIPQFLEIWLFEFSPDNSKVVILGFPKEFDDGETDPEFMFLSPSTLIVLEWPSLTELYRYDPGIPGPDDNDLRGVQWTPDGDALYVTNYEWKEDEHEYARFLTRIDLATEKVMTTPFEPWNFTVSPEGNQVIAWGNSVDDGKWLWTNELLVYNAQDLTILETIVVPEIQQIGFVYPDKAPNQFLLAEPSNCWELETVSGMYAPDVSQCENAVYKFQTDTGSLELLFDLSEDSNKMPNETREAGGDRMVIGSFDPSDDSIMMPNDTRHYDAQTGMLIVDYVNRPNIISFVDVNKQCVVLELDPWPLGARGMQWYDEEHIVDVALATRENRTPVIHVYHIQELAAETAPSCLRPLPIVDN